MTTQTFPIELRLGTGHTLTKTLTTVAFDGREYVCLKSVIEAMYMSWVVWGMYLRGCAEEFGLLRHNDEYLRGTLLVRPQALPRLIARLYNLPELAQRWTARHRLLALQMQWGECWAGRCGQAQEAPDILPRKVTPQLVRELHAFVTGGTLVKKAARELGIAVKVARRVANGNYDMDTATTLAWAETFGGMRPGKVRQTADTKAGTGGISAF